MQKLKQLGGKDVIKIFESYGFEVKRTVGSHVRLSLKKDGSTYHVTIPLHSTLRKGTLHSIVKDFEICFGGNETKKNFYN